MIKEFIIDKKAQGEFNMIYMLLIIAIVAIVLIAKIKPMFKGAISSSSQQAKSQGVSTPDLKK